MENQNNKIDNVDCENGGHLHEPCNVSFLGKVFVFLITLYQKLISPLLGDNCRFYPNCSQYAKDALGEHGIFKGTILSLKRVLKCNPFHSGGIDFVPKRKINKNLYG